MRKGKWIGELQAGHEVTLPDGRMIKPEQVWSSKKRSDGEKPNLLVVEVVSEERLVSLVDSPLLNVSVSVGFVMG